MASKTTLQYQQSIQKIPLLKANYILGIKKRHLLARVLIVCKMCVLWDEWYTSAWTRAIMCLLVFCNVADHDH
jgi:hypothetical protein